MQAIEATMHELAVHQEELEIQNDNLRQAEVELQVARDRYFQLFDLAPVAYLTLDQSGVIQEANLTAATLLQVKRKALLRRRLSSFVTSQDADSFHLYQGRVVESGSNLMAVRFGWPLWTSR
jgi:PAS domain-containing protein